MTIKKQVLSKISASLDFLLRRFFRIFFTLIVLASITAAFLHSVLVIFIAIAFLLIIFLLLSSVALMKKSLGLLLHHQASYSTLVYGYASGVAGIIFFFAISYNILAAFGGGFLTYGHCSDALAVAERPLDSVKTITGYIYFSSITFFTVGYGDICPVGLSRLLAIVNAFAGQIFSTIIVALALGTFINNKDKKG